MVIVLDKTILVALGMLCLVVLAFVVVWKEINHDLLYTIVTIFSSVFSSIFTYVAVKSSTPLCE